MSGPLDRRLAALEAKSEPAQARPWHQLIGESDAELQQKMADLIARGEASEDDNFILRKIIDHPPRDDARGVAKTTN
jgi:hypothetical protein